jgi:hypothetical protein
MFLALAPQHFTADLLRRMIANRVQEEACGVMAHPECPIDLRDDEDALAEFPPKPLPGLRGDLIWSSARVACRLSGRAG